MRWRQVSPQSCRFLFSWVEWLCLCSALSANISDVSLIKSPETKRRKIVGRGTGTGLGKTSGHGQKGQKSRSGVSIKPWFEGGQSPLYRRIPKRGFNNARFTTRYATINLSDLNKFFKDIEDIQVGDIVLSYNE